MPSTCPLAHQTRKGQPSAAQQQHSAKLRSHLLLLLLAAATLGVVRRRLLPLAGATGASKQGLGLRQPLLLISLTLRRHQQQQMQLPAHQALQQASHPLLLQRQ